MTFFNLQAIRTSLLFFIHLIQGIRFGLQEFIGYILEQKVRMYIHDKGTITLAVRLPSSLPIPAGCVVCHSMQKEVSFTDVCLRRESR